jgi:16S rRNA (cytidine1402-2'-O)-methyltransferase
VAAKLYLVPSTLGEFAPLATLPQATLEIVSGLDHWVVETPKLARRFLQAAGVALRLRKLDFKVLDEHTPDSRLPELLAPALGGADLGVLCDAGCPGVADPGARLVRLAHTQSVLVVPLVGPSAILLALMGSGLNGQRFVFHGYLPIDPLKRTRALRDLERISAALDQTQIAIETPYRNNQLLDALLKDCAEDTRLCIAADLTLPGQYIRTRRIGEWRTDRPNLNKRPTVFLINAAH